MSRSNKTPSLQLRCKYKIPQCRFTGLSRMVMEVQYGSRWLLITMVTWLCAPGTNSNDRYLHFFNHFQTGLDCKAVFLKWNTTKITFSNIFIRKKNTCISFHLSDRFEVLLLSISLSELNDDSPLYFLITKDLLSSLNQYWYQIRLLHWDTPHWNHVFYGLTNKCAISQGKQVKLFAIKINQMKRYLYRVLFAE